MSTKYGADFIPKEIVFPEMNGYQKEMIRMFVKKLWEPIDKKEFGELWSRLYVLTVPRQVRLEEKLAINAYYDEMRQYPASVVRFAMTRVFKWFPSYAELKEICDDECRLFTLLKNQIEAA